MIEPGMDLSNTPGIYYALAYWFSCSFFIGMYHPKLKGWSYMVAHGLFFAVLASVMVLTDGIMVVWFFPCIIFYIFLMLTFIKICCGMDWAKAGYFTVRAFILGEFVASLEWQLFYFSVTVLKFPLEMWVQGTVLVLVYTLVFTVMYQMEHKYGDGYSALRISGKEVCAVAALCFAVFSVSNLSYGFKNTPFSSQFTAEIFIIRTLVDLGGVIMLYAYHTQLQALGMRMEMESLQNMLHMHYTNYRVSEESIALVQRKYHDLKHQIQLLRSEIDSLKKLEYLDQLEQEIKAFEAQNKTGNHVLDTILMTKSLQCQSLGISLTCVADGKLLDFMHPMDISALFGNALDNAMEGVSKIGAVDKRLIHVSVAQQKQFLRIRVENCYEGDIHFKNGMPVTTKEDKKHHGFGLKSMQSTVEKYNGSMTIQAKDGWFELRILFPL